jgi:hypothetical protein
LVGLGKPWATVKTLRGIGDFQCLYKADGSILHVSKDILSKGTMCIQPELHSLESREAIQYLYA